jgi:hypothetical protein
MWQFIPMALRRAGHLFTIGWVTVSLVLLAAPAWTLANQNQPAGTDQAVVRERTQTDYTLREAPRYRAESSEERRALDQKPELTEDVKLRVETYTGNNYSK